MGMSIEVKLRPMESAPKDRTILLDVELPWLVVGVWNEVNEEWVYANLQACDNDTYFENEYEKKPLGWVSMPEIVKEGK